MLSPLAVGAVPRKVAGYLKRRILAGAATPAARIFGPEGSGAGVHTTREAVAAAFLTGDGIEIGALHQPLRVPAAARVRYVDRMTNDALLKHYPNLTEPFVEIDVLDDGETLATFGEATQDFVIANHFIEHCQNPIQTLQNLFRVLRTGGILYLAVPDKRFTFDVDRPATTIDHLLRDFTDGPAWSKYQHFEEWSRLVNKRTDPAVVDEETRHLIDIDYSIHFHVWGAVELMEFVTLLRRFIDFELELFLRNGFETILILRKHGERAGIV